MRFKNAVVPAFAAALVGVAASSAQAQLSSGQDVYRPNPGIQNPTEIKFTEPKYTQEALDRKIQGMVVLEAVIDTAGKVRDVRIVQSLDKQYGLDDQAVEAVKGWLFRPAMKENVPVPTIVTLEVAFRLPNNAVRQAVVARPPQERMKLPDDGFAAGAQPEDTPGLVAPRVLKQPEPKYTSDAIRNKIQGIAVVEAVIGVDGTVTKARILESLDKTYGLDQCAVDAVRGWTFEPGKLSGQPVPVYARFEIVFRLH